MKSFKDATGREWKVELNFTALKRVKEIAKLDLLDTESLKKLRDLIEVVDVLFAVCKPAADEAQIKDEQFADLLVPCFDEAVESFFAELEDFFRRLGRTALASLILKVRSWSTKEQQARADLVMDPETDAKVSELLDAELTKAKTTLHSELQKAIAGATAAGSPASSESISDY